MEIPDEKNKKEKEKKEKKLVNFSSILSVHAIQMRSSADTRAAQNCVGSPGIAARKKLMSCEQHVAYIRSARRAVVQRMNARDAYIRNAGG